MSEKRAWMVRAGNSNELVEDFWNKSMVAIGWKKMGDWSKLQTKEDFKAKMKEVFPEWSEQSLNVNCGIVFRFAREMKVGDYVLSYDKSAREYLVGKVAGDDRYDPQAISEHYPHVRPVKWINKIPRDKLSIAARNALGSTLTVFSVDAYIDEFERLLKGEAEEASVVVEEQPIFYDEIKEKADELISDVISKIDPFEFQHLVAALLRAMGFRTKVSNWGPDMGVDIIAHPDAFGFQSPRIKVQVKHKLAPTTVHDIRSFIATLHEGENGLFVSTGGFTKDARIEAGMTMRRVTLIDRDGFIDLLLEHYDELEPEYQAMVPLRKVYIPVSREG